MAARCISSNYFAGDTRIHQGDVNNYYEYRQEERPETPPKPSSNIPFRRDNDFVERKSLLDRIYRACSEPASRAALVGLGGVGKSQLAIEHAYRVKNEFIQNNDEIWVFWIHAETHARVKEGFQSIADAAKIPGRNQPKADILRLVYQWLQNERNGRWLMILDSADNIDVFCNNADKAGQTTDEAEKKPLSAYLPQSSNGSIIITTRNKALAYRLTGSYENIIEVGPMDQGHALELLIKKSKKDADMDTATKLVEALECIPLAISQAAAYIQRRAPRTSISKYLEELRRSERKMSKLLNQDSGDLRRDESAKNSVIATWQISFDYIRSNRPPAADLLSLMSFFDRQGILESLIQPLDRDRSSGTDTDNESVSSGDSIDDTFEEDIKTLRDYCLVQTNEKGDVFEMHGLVQLSTRTWLDAYGESERFKKQYINRMALAFPTGNFENWSTCQKLFPHAEKAINYRPIDKVTQMKWALILHNGGWYSREQGRYTMSETMATMSRNVYKTVLGPDHLDTLTSIANLALTYRGQGRWNEAESLLLQVIETLKTVLGPEHPDTLTSMAELALTYWNQGRWKEAESLFVQVVEIEKTVLGPEHPGMLVSIANLALVYQNQGRWKEAESLEVQVMETKKTVLGLEHPSTLTSMNNLAYTWKYQGCNVMAIQLMEDCIQICRRVLGPDHPDTLSSLSALSAWREELVLS